MEEDNTLVCHAHGLDFHFRAVLGLKKKFLLWADMLRQSLPWVRCFAKSRYLGNFPFINYYSMRCDSASSQTKGKFFELILMIFLGRCAITMGTMCSYL